jgi:hypothetical protein
MYFLQLNITHLYTIYNYSKDFQYIINKYYDIINTTNLKYNIYQQNKFTSKTYQALNNNFNNIKYNPMRQYLNTINKYYGNLSIKSH